MNHDVEQAPAGAVLHSEQQPMPTDGHDGQPQPRPTKIFTQLRSFSTLFGSTAPTEEGMTPTPTPTRPSSPQRRFAAVKSIFTQLGARGARNLPPARIAVPPQSQAMFEVELEGGEPTPRYELPAWPLGSEFADEHEPPSATLSASGSYGSSASEPDDTPPLTPESLVTDISALAHAVHFDYGGVQDDNYGGAHDDDAYMDDAYVPSLRPHSVEIKEGKKPARPIDYDALLADISSDGDGPARVPCAEPADDADEWYGLEYTLELSTRERRASETHAFSAGEHSKSRESWAAIHAGTIHPFFEDEEYGQWKNWHRYLERQDEKRRTRRGRAFKARAKELAWVYAEEVHTRDLIAWQMEVYGDVDKGLYERLGMLEGHRPDPYHPLQKHGLGWELKRSRSVAALRELCALPEPTFPQRRALGKA